MNLQLRQSYSLFARLLLLAAVFVAVQSSYAAPQSQQNVSTSFLKLRSRAEQGDAVAQYNLAQSYLRHDPPMRTTNLPSSGSVPPLPKVTPTRNSSSAICTSMARAFPRLHKAPTATVPQHSRATRPRKQSGLSVSARPGAPKNLAKRSNGISLPPTRESCGPVQSGDPLLPGRRRPARLRGGGHLVSRGSRFRSPEAQNSLAVFYYRGLGVALDYTEAARWLRLAAERALPAAETNLAYLYEQGKGLPLDYVAAYTWYSRALAAGDASGAGRRKQLSHLMTRKQLDEAASLLALSSQPQRQPSPAADGTLSLLQSH